MIDDYGHHPVEIAAVLSAAREATDGQRHRRRAAASLSPALRDLFDEFCTCFNDADTVLVADVYAAGEAPIEGVNRDALVDGLRARGHRNVAAAGRARRARRRSSHELARPGDIVVCLGAGSITNWAHSLPAELDAAARRAREGGDDARAQRDR